jgi:hypothetical protein
MLALVVHRHLQLGPRSNAFILLVSLYVTNMINPYGGPFTNHFDQAVTGILVMLFVGISAAILSKIVRVDASKQERMCVALAFSFFALAFIVSVNLFLGWLLLFKLRIESPLWALWQLGYTLCVIAVFQILPFVGIAITGWAVYRHARLKRGATAMTVAALGVFLLGISAILVFQMH